jgi:hypothetical protein
MSNQNQYQNRDKETIMSNQNQYQNRDKETIMSNQNQLNFIAPIATPVAENYKALKALLQQLDTFHKAFDAIGTVHFARFLFLEKDANDTDDIYTQFALFSSYDEDFDRYVRDFVNKVGGLFDELFKHLEGGKEVTPVQQNIPAFKEYLKKYDRKSEHLYSAYPKLSVVQILAKFPTENESQKIQ